MFFSTSCQKLSKWHATRLGSAWGGPYGGLGKKMKQRTRARNAPADRLALGLIVMAALVFATAAGAASRIKDLANVEGVRENQLIGYGLVVGLNGTGDTLNNIPFTKQSLQAMLERMGVNIRGATIRTGNVAAVMVTGNLPAFGTQGTRMDVTVSALGDAKNLMGGTLF